MLEDEISACSAEDRVRFLVSADRLLGYEIIDDQRGSRGGFVGFVQAVAEAARCLRAYEDRAGIPWGGNGEVETMRRKLAVHLGAVLSRPALGKLCYTSLGVLRDLHFETLGATAGIDRVEAEIGQRDRVATMSVVVLEAAVHEVAWAVRGASGVKCALSELLRLAAAIETRCAEAARACDSAGRRVNCDTIIALICGAVARLDDPVSERLLAMLSDERVRNLVGVLDEIGSTLSRSAGTDGAGQCAEIGLRMAAEANALRTLGRAVCRGVDVAAEGGELGTDRLSIVCDEVLSSHYRVALDGDGRIHLLEGEAGCGFQRYIEAWLEELGGGLVKGPVSARDGPTTAISSFRHWFESGRSIYSVQDEEDVGGRKIYPDFRDWPAAAGMISELVAGDDELFALVAGAAGGGLAALERGLASPESPCRSSNGARGFLAGGKLHSNCDLTGGGGGAYLAWEYSRTNAERFVDSATGTATALDPSVSRCILTMKIHVGRDKRARLCEPVRYSYDLKAVESRVRGVPKMAASTRRKDTTPPITSVAKQALVAALDLLVLDRQGQINGQHVGPVESGVRERTRYLESLLDSAELKLGALGQDELLNLHRALKTLRLHHGSGLVQSEIERRKEAR